MADDRDDQTPQEPTEEPTADREAAEAADAQEPVSETLSGGHEGGEPAAEAEEAEPAAPEPPAPEPVAESEEAEPAAPEPVAEGEEAEPAAPEPVAESEDAEPAAPEPVAEGEEAPAPTAGEPVAEGDDVDEDEEEEPAARVKPEIPGADLEVDIVTEGADPFGRGESIYDEDEEPEPVVEEPDDVPEDQPIAAVAIDLAAGARYRATGKRKTAVARVTLKPGDGSYLINGRSLEQFFPRTTLQRNIRQPLEAVGYEARMDVVARMHGGGVSAQAGALRHGISRALLEADPNLRGELKRRGFLTRDPRVKERKKAGLKKARKRPQFSKR
jgi:small subunit ribosomal protein S9